MAKVDIEEMKADREAGTDGGWYTHPGSPRDVFVGDGELMATAYPMNHRPDIVAEANARRIARLPELEAAYIEAVKALELIATLGSRTEAAIARKFFEGR